MLTEREFDLWADRYDKSVALSESENAYPFAGYKNVLNAVYRAVRESGARRVLDVGFGTGVLTQRLYLDGCMICGVDFSQEMLQIARTKMPQAELLQWDFSKGLPPALNTRSFDVIVSTYAIHHLNDGEKEALLTQLCARLAPGGKVLLGDIAFQDRAALECCRAQSGADWDDEESYMVFEELKQAFPAAAFTPISHCAGVVVIPKE